MWKFIQKIFRNAETNKKSVPDRKIEMTFDVFLNDDSVKQVIGKLRKETILLNPRSGTSSSKEKSKMGGQPNLAHFVAYPMCDSCRSPLNFVLQIDKQDFPEFYWPNDKNFFQLFRCPNYDCSGAFSDRYDLKMFHYYFSHTGDQEKVIPKPDIEITNREAEVNACVFHREKAHDYPMFDSFTYPEYESIQMKYADELIDEFEEKFSPKQQSKILGYPSFTQNTFYPTCTCGKEKEFFFQLASEDRVDDRNAKSSLGNEAWSHHGIMIGDVGNIYYFVCKNCGEQSIESYWDCS